MPKDGYGWGGTVIVRVSVNQLGDVTDAEFATGPGPVCGWVQRQDVVVTRERAVELARQAKFTPAMSGGVPIASTALIAIEFVASETSKAKMKAEPVLGEYSGPVKESKNATPTLVGSEASKSDTSEKPLRLAILGSPDDSPRPAIPAGQGASPSDMVKTFDGNTVSGGVLNGKAMSLPKPKYPAAARAVRASGAVQVQVLIDTDGGVFAATATAGHPLLQAASVTAACNAKFTPTLLAGQPVKVSGIIVYNFVP
jgi:TonB family protein